ncbi:transposon ty3-I gag-pol polyprotein [Tanacetum coccineum]
MVFEDPMMELKNLKQDGNVQSYQEQFEALLNKVELDETHAISLFLGGLKKEISMPIRMFSLVSLNDVYYLAKMQEHTNIAVKSRYTPVLPTPTTKLHVTSSFANRNNNYASRNVVKPNTGYARKQLTQKELEEKRAKNLCCYCDQKYVPGHKCSGQLHCLEVIACEECDYVEESLDNQCLEDEVVMNEEEEIVATTENCPQISLNALNGVHSYQTMRVKGQVGKKTLQILIDCGSTHNFLDLQKAKRMGCRLTSTCPLQVEVANGNNMVSTYKCKNFKWTLQGMPYETEVILLPLGGCDMVLGIQWLATLGDIICNFGALTMEYSYKGQRIALRCVTPAALKWIQGSVKAALSSMMVCVYPDELCAFTTKDSEGGNLRNKEINAVVEEFSNVFDVPKSLPPQRSHDHQIPLQNGTPPVNIRPYRHPPSQKDAIESMVKELLDTGVIRNSQSLFSSPIVMVKKKDGSWRMCVDYRQLNKYTVKDKFPIPVIKELIDELHGAKVFSKLDLRSGQSVEEHVQHLKEVLQLMRTHTLFAKLTMKDWPMPKNIKQFRGFLGLTGYYRRFIRDYALISKPLTLLLKKQGFVWNKDAECAFYKLKEAMMQAPVLALPNFGKEFIIETDASGTGIGAVLQQDGHPIAYMSKSLFTKHQALSTYEKEFLAVLLALEKWRGYVLDRHFIIKTNNLSLKYLLDQRFTTPFQTKWLPKLLGYDYQIMYKNGNDNATVDALSRVQMNHGEISAMMVTSVVSELLEKIQQSCQDDPVLSERMLQLANDTCSSSKYTLVEGKLRRKGKLIVGNNESLRKQIFLYFHAEANGGHSGIMVITKKMSVVLYWKGMRKMIKQ